MSENGISNWERLVIGDPDCYEIAKLLEDMQTATETVFTLWKELSIQLELEQVEIIKLDQHFKLPNVNVRDMLCRILRGWIEKNHSEATLGKLMYHLKELNLYRCAAKLEGYGTKISNKHVVCTEIPIEEPAATAYSPLNGLAIPNPKFSNNHKIVLTNFYIASVTICISILAIFLVIFLLELKVKTPPDECRLNFSHTFQIGSYQEYLKFASLKCVKHLSIFSVNSTQWEGKIDVRNAEYIESVRFEGSLLQSTITGILCQTTNLVELNFGPCKQPDNHAVATSHTDYIYLPHIQHITFLNLTLCSHILSMFSLFSPLNNLQRLRLHGTFLDSNVVDVHTLLQLSMPSLRYVDFSGDVYTTKSVFQGDTIFLSVREVSFNLRVGSLAYRQVRTQLDSSFCKQFKSVETFENSEGMKYEELLNLLEYCHKLKNITATVLIQDETELWDINQVELKQKLEVVSIYFVFQQKCPTRDKLQVLGLDEFKASVKTYTFISNCF